MRGGLLGIYATQSDDVALGIPVLSIIYGDASFSILYILSTLQALLINPTGYVMLSYAKAKGAAASADDGKPGVALSAVVTKVVSDLLKNPLVLSVLCGLVYRPTLGPTLPWWLDTPLELLGRTFAPLVYLIGGSAIRISRPKPRCPRPATDRSIAARTFCYRWLCVLRLARGAHLPQLRRDAPRHRCAQVPGAANRGARHARSV